MKRQTIFASAAKAAFALAAVVMMSTVFTSCSKDNDEPKPEPKANTVTIDGAERPIVKAEYADMDDGDACLDLYASDDDNKMVEIQLNKDLHMTGSAIDLTQKEANHDGNYNWLIEYDKPDGTTLIYTYGRPGNEDPVFTTGTLTISGSPESTLNIRLENGRVKGKDGAEHTLTISYSGTMTKEQ